MFTVSPIGHSVATWSPWIWTFGFFEGPMGFIAMKPPTIWGWYLLVHCSIQESVCTPKKPMQKQRSCLNGLYVSTCFLIGVGRLRRQNLDSSFLGQKHAKTWLFQCFHHVHPYCSPLRSLHMKTNKPLALFTLIFLAGTLIFTCAIRSKFPLFPYSKGIVIYPIDKDVYTHYKDSYFSGWDDHTTPPLQGVFFGPTRRHTHTHVFQVVESVEDLLEAVHIKPLQVGANFSRRPEGFFVTEMMFCVFCCF